MDNTLFIPICILISILSLSVFFSWRKEGF
jgi:hypothetical protein